MSAAYSPTFLVEEGGEGSVEDKGEDEDEAYFSNVSRTNGLLLLSLSKFEVLFLSEICAGLLSYKYEEEEEEEESLSAGATANAFSVSGVVGGGDESMLGMIRSSASPVPRLTSLLPPRALPAKGDVRDVEAAGENADLPLLLLGAARWRLSRLLLLLLRPMLVLLLLLRVLLLLLLVSLFLLYSLSLSKPNAVASS